MQAAKSTAVVPAKTEETPAKSAEDKAALEKKYEDLLKQYGGKLIILLWLYLKPMNLILKI